MRIIIAFVLTLAQVGTALALSDAQIPTKIPTYWGSGAAPANITCPIPVPSQISVQGGRASWTDGFPPLTFQPSLSGGVPPFGQDFNGVFCQLSQWSRWMQAGGPLVYDATFQTGIGGYPSGAVIQSAISPGIFWRSTADNNTSNPDAGGANWVLAFQTPPTIYTGGGTANAQTVTVPGATSLSLILGLPIVYTPAITNTGPTQLTVSSLAAKNVMVQAIQSGATGLQPLGGQELQAGRPARVMWDGTEYILLNPYPPVYTQFYASPTGTDSGNCTQSGSPCHTISYAVQQALNSCSGNAVQTVNLAAGTYNETVNVQGTSPCSQSTAHNDALLISGAGSASTTWNGGNSQCGTLIANNGSNVGVQNMTMEAAGALCQNILYAQLGGLIQVFGGMVFANANTNVGHFFCENPGSQIEIWNSYTVSGGYTPGYHAEATQVCMIEWNPVGIVVNYPNTAAPDIAYFVAKDAADLFIDSTSFTGGATSGVTGIVSLNGVLNTNGAGLTSLPGGHTCNQTTGGQCQ